MNPKLSTVMDTYLVFVPLEEQMLINIYNLKCSYL